MLNISENSISSFVDSKKFNSLNLVENKISGKVFRNLISWGLGLFLVLLFLPWTQNIRSNGMITTLQPQQSPQGLHSVIGGRIEEWYVQEGDFVKLGDTILKISEIKDEYFDTQLIQKTSDQVNFKKESILTYENKVKAQESQLEALTSLRDFKIQQSKIKLEQIELKVRIDSAAYEAAKINLKTAQIQLNRMDSLYRMGLKSLTDFESRNLKYQETLAKENEAKNKWLNSKNEQVSVKLEISNVSFKYESDYNKIQSEKFTTISNKLDNETNLSKLENKLINYQFRNGLYFITAPQDGYITKTISKGIGETIKDGQQILTIMPSDYQLGVEMYVDPIDLPLIQIGENVRIQFDGWPAIVFNGWPNVSYGTYAGKIYAIDQFTSNNGKYRLLISQDVKEEEWPSALRFGSGATSLIMLNNVPIWYEIWRKINGFPPDFYQALSTNNVESKSVK